MRTVTIHHEKLPGREPPALDRHAAETRNNLIPEVRGEPDFWRVQNIDLDRRLINRLTGDGTLVLSLTFGVLPEDYKRERNWKKPKLKVVEICGFAKGSELEQTYQDLLSLSFLLRGNPIVKGIIQ